MSSLEEIGALLGFVAFVGLAVLVFLTFQQARHLRRLRDWAGRAPERAAAMAARESEVAEGERTEVDERLEGDADQVPGEARPRRFDRLRTRLGETWTEIDRRSPADPRLLLGGLAAILLGVGIATGGFGVLGDESSSDPEARQGKQGGGASREKAKKTEVAVLNGTAPPGGTGVAGVADRVSQDVEAAGFRVGAVDNAGSFTTSVVMFSGSGDKQAQELADSLASVLGSVAVEPMTPDVEALAGGADIALIVGQDDAGI